MKILLVSPLGYAINEQTKYGGIERLVHEFAKELHRLGHSVTVSALVDSQFPEGVGHIAYRAKLGEDIFQIAEANAYKASSYLIRRFDVIHDFSHQHLISRFNPNMPTLNPFWHAPAVARFPKAPYNVIALSQWAKREFERVYNQKAVYQPTIVIDTGMYCLSRKHRNERWLSLGAITPRKGHIEAIRLCRHLGLPLDVVGKGGDDPQYLDMLQGACDGQQIRFLGEVTDEEKVKLYQTNRALLYLSNEAEVTNHKLQEAMLCGMPVIVPAIGAMPEIVTHGIDGFLYRTEKELIEAVKKVDTLKANKEMRGLYSPEKIVGDYVPLYERVGNEERW